MIFHFDWPGLDEVSTRKLNAVAKSCDILIVQACVTGGNSALVDLQG